MILMMIMWTMTTMMMSTHCIDRRTYVDPVLYHWAAKPEENEKMRSMTLMINALEIDLTSAKLSLLQPWDFQ